MSDVTDVNHRAVHLLDRYIVERCDCVRAAVETYGKFAFANFRSAAGKGEVLCINGIADVERRKALG